MASLTVFEVVSLFVGIASLVVAGFAIWQANYWYKESKKTETSTRETLAEIKTTGKILERLTHRQLDKYVDYVTGTPKENPIELLSMLLATVTEFTFPKQSPPKPGYPIENIVNDKAMVIYYSFYSNVLAQGYISASIQEQNTEDQRTYIKILDDSKNSFDQTLRLLESTDVVEILKKQGWEPWMKYWRDYTYRILDLVSLNAIRLQG